MKQITVRFPDDVAARLVERAEQERRTLSGLIVYLCDLGTRRPSTGVRKPKAAAQEEVALSS